MVESFEEDRSIVDVIATRMRGISEAIRNDVVEGSFESECVDRRPTSSVEKGKLGTEGLEGE